MIKTARQRLLYVISDFLMTNVAWFIFNVIRYQTLADTSFAKSLHAFLTMEVVMWGQVLFPLLMLTIFYLSGYYNNVFMKSRMEELLNTITTTLTGTILIYFIAIIDDPIPDRMDNYALLVSLFLLMFTLVYMCRIAITLRTIRLIRSGDLTQKALIIGNRDDMANMIHRIKSKRGKMGLDIAGCVPMDGLTAADGNMPAYRMEDLPHVCRDNNISHIILVPDGQNMKQTLDVINNLFPLDLPILITPDTYHIIMSGVRFRNIVGEPMIDISRACMSDSTVNIKRAMDIAVSAAAMILLSPVFAAIAIAVRCDSTGPAIYRQERVGRHKKKFDILKFRTMHTDAESDGPALSATDDPRITRVGHFLRKYRLDELPQFWNVLKGDMSLVGPRPEREYFIRRILEKAPYYTLVHQVRPGITSWGMVRYGYASDVDGMIHRLKYDLMYIENVSMLVDLKILFYTVHTVITGKGV